MSAISLASFGFFVGAIGQAVFYGILFPHLPKYAFVIWLVPWLTVFTISFCRQALFGPRPFRWCLIFAMCWYSILALLAEGLYRMMQPSPSEHTKVVVARALMYLGALSFIVFVRACITLRRYETSNDA
jgi:hypothetical protein